MKRTFDRFYTYAMLNAFALEGFLTVFKCLRTFQIICGDFLIQLHDQVHEVQAKLGMSSACKMPPRVAPPPPPTTDSGSTAAAVTGSTPGVKFDFDLAKLSECPICRHGFDSGYKNSFVVGSHFASCHFGDDISRQLGLVPGQQHHRVLV